MFVSRKHGRSLGQLAEGKCAGLVLTSRINGSSTACIGIVMPPHWSISCTSRGGNTPNVSCGLLLTEAANVTPPMSRCRGHIQTSAHRALQTLCPKRSGSCSFTCLSLASGAKVISKGETSHCEAVPASRTPCKASGRKVARHLYVRGAVESGQPHRQHLYSATH